MPDAIEQLRAAAEADLTAALERLNARGRRLLTAAVREYGSVQAIPGSVWQEVAEGFEAEVAAIMLLLLANTYDQTRRQAGVRLSSEELQAVAADARPIAEGLGRQVVRDHLDGARASIAQKMAAVDDAVGAAVVATDKVKATVDEVLDDSRLERTVSTSTTRGVTLGQFSGGEAEARRRGLAIDYKWRTERDSRVCPICSPLDGQPSTKWESILSGKQTAATIQQVLSGPPGHPNCRCKLEPYFPSGANYNSGPAFTVGGGVNVRN